MGLKRKITSNSNTNPITKKTRILAIDPGTKIMGYADFESGNLVDYGLKLFKPMGKIESLLNEIETVVERLILEKQPTVIILEKNRFSQITNNVRLTLAIARIKSVSKRHRIRLLEFAPNTVRAIVCKNGYSTKSDLAKTIVSRYPEVGLFIRNQSCSSLNLFYNITDAVACGQAFIELNSTKR